MRCDRYLNPACPCVRLTKLLNDGLELSEVSLVLALVLDLLLDTLKDADGGGVVVDLAGCAEGSLDDVGRGDEVVGEAVVEAALELEEVTDLREEGLVALVELLVRLLGLVRRVAGGWGLAESTRMAGGEGGGGAAEAAAGHGPCGIVYVVLGSESQGCVGRPQVRDYTAAGPPARTASSPVNAAGRTAAASAGRAVARRATRARERTILGEWRWMGGLGGMSGE